MVLPAETLIIGQHFKKFKSGELFKGIETPDGRNVINIDSQSDSILVLKNPNDSSFSKELKNFKHHKFSNIKIVSNIKKFVVKKT